MAILTVTLLYLDSGMADIALRGKCSCNLFAAFFKTCKSISNEEQINPNYSTDRMSIDNNKFSNR